MISAFRKILIFTTTTFSHYTSTPAGSDPEFVCQKESFLKVTVSLRGFGPFVATGKTFCETALCSSYEKQGRNLLSPGPPWAPFVRPIRGLGIKKKTSGKIQWSGANPDGGAGARAPPREINVVNVDLLLRACTWHAACKCMRVAVGERPYQRTARR